MVSVSPAALNTVWESSALIPLAPKSHVSFKACTQLWTEFFIFHISVRINCNRISEGLLYLWDGSDLKLIKQSGNFCWIKLHVMTVMQLSKRRGTEYVCGNEVCVKPYSVHLCVKLG
jgi:hypothetical protein